MDILKNLFGRDRPHKETLIDFGPWNEDSAVPIYNELLRVKHYESIFDFTDEETRRMFNRPKSEVHGTYGILGRILGYGTIVVTGTGGTRTPFKNIAAPMDFRQRVYDYLSAE